MQLWIQAEPSQFHQYKCLVVEFPQHGSREVVEGLNALVHDRFLENDLFERLDFQLGEITALREIPQPLEALQSRHFLLVSQGIPYPKDPARSLRVKAIWSRLRSVVRIIDRSGKIQSTPIPLEEVAQLEEEICPKSRQFGSYL